MHAPAYDAPRSPARPSLRRTRAVAHPGGRMPLATAHRALLDERRPLTRAEVDAVAALPLDELPSLVALAHQVRLAYMGSAVELESLINAKSGACPEDCAFCSQSVRFDTAGDLPPLLHPPEGPDA